MFTRVRPRWPILQGSPNDILEIIRAINYYLASLEQKDALYISQAQIHADEGIQFPASQVASSDANNLDDYKEATWTPTDASGAALTLTVNDAVYTKVGRLVVLQLDVTYPVTANASAAAIGGVPYAAGHKGQGAVITSGAGSPVVAQISGSTISFFSATGAAITNANMSGATIRTTISYMV